MSNFADARRPLTCLLAAGAIVAALAACGSSPSGGSAPAKGPNSAASADAALDAPRGGTLTIATSAPFPLDPAEASPPFVVEAAYDSLIHQNTDGSYSPDLATSWGFTDGHHQVFQLKLRSGVKFSDGTPMTAATVVGSLNRILHTPGPNGTAGPVTSIKALNSSTVQLTYATPEPLSFVLYSFSQTPNFGLIVGPQGTANPKLLTSESDGVGPYKLDAAASNSTTVTFVPNSQYFHQKAIKWSKVVVTVMTDPTAEMDALKTGQIDYAFNMAASTVSQAKASGLQVSEHGATDDALILIGRKTGPLANLQVRQAIAYAIDRESIAKALTYGVGTPQSGIPIKGDEGYDSSTANPFPYNLAKAKQLLASTPYASGVTLKVLDFTPVDQNSAYAQAISSQLAQIGVKVQITAISTGYTQFLAASASGKYDAEVTALPGGDVYSNYQSFLAPKTIGNPQSVTDPTLSRLLTASADQPTAAAESQAMIAVGRQLNQQVWATPIVVTPNVDLATARVANIQQGGPNGSPYPFDPTGKEAWYQKNA